MHLILMSHLFLRHACMYFLEKKTLESTPSCMYFLEKKTLESTRDLILV